MKPQWGFRAEPKACAEAQVKSHFLRQAMERANALSIAYYKETWDLNGFGGE
jgi:hypothetical protein